MLTPCSFEDISNDRLRERIDALHQSFTDQCEPSTNLDASINQIFEHLHENLHRRDTLIDEYNRLSQTIQTVISQCSQCVHERYKYENEFLLIKDQICQSLGQIGHIQQSLDHYRTIIDTLEHESQRLENLLSHPQFSQMNQQKYQVFEQNQRIQIDRLGRENEQVRDRIRQEKEAIIILQRDIERDQIELDKLQKVYAQLQSEGEQIHQYRLKTEKRRAHLQTTAKHVQQMEKEYHRRLKTTKDQYHLAQKQHQSLATIHEETIQQRLQAEAKEQEVIVFRF